MELKENQWNLTSRSVRGKDRLCWVFPYRTKRGDLKYSIRIADVNDLKRLEKMRVARISHLSQEMEDYKGREANDCIQDTINFLMITGNKERIDELEGLNKVAPMDKGTINADSETVMRFDEEQQREYFKSAFPKVLEKPKRERRPPRSKTEIELDKQHQEHLKKMKKNRGR